MTRADEAGWKALAGPRLEVQEFSSAQGEVISTPIPFLKEFGHFFWGWDPKKELKNTSDPVFREPMSELNEVMRNLFVNFDVSDTGHFRKAWFEPVPGVRFRGLFGIHDFSKKRPLIVIRMGIHGNLDEMTAERFLARISYEDLDANFLVLESLTSPAFLSRNQNISFGGVDEGILTFLALHEIDGGVLHSLVSSYHLLSISLGGQGTFVSALLDQHGRHLIKSVVDFCPLINLQSTFEYHSRPGFKNSLIDFWNSRRLKVLLDVYGDEPGLSGRWKTFFDFKPRFTPALLGILNRDRRRPLVSVEQLREIAPELKWPGDLEEHFKNSGSFFELNNFWPYYLGVSTPVTIYTTPKDPLVINDLNSEMIFSGRQEGDFTSLRYHRLEKGIHCGIASVYQWDYVVGLVREGLELK